MFDSLDSRQFLDYYLRRRRWVILGFRASPEDRSRIAVGVFLKAAYEVLGLTKKPLTAPEIVEAARTLGLLKTSGKTPEQTMKSKLATNILMNGDRSPFMRAAKGRFALRGWKGEYPEHVADRYQKALVDEDI